MATKQPRQAVENSMTVRFPHARVCAEDSNGVVLELFGGNVVNLDSLHKAVEESDLGKLGKAAIHESLERVVFEDAVISHVERA